jgi:uncharacterized protein YprB with RNaseH-like and TPR domain
MRGAVRKEIGSKWYQQAGTRIGIIDIETDGLQADFSTMLTWCIKEKGGALFSDIITKEQLFSPNMDKELIASCVHILENFDIIVGYYSKRFDMPFLRAKALHYGIEFPGYDALYHWDLYDTVKTKLRISRRSLDAACDYLGIIGKTSIEKEIWRKAKYGDVDAISKVLEHNIADVEITEQLYDKLEFSRKWARTVV